MLRPPPAPQITTRPICGRQTPANTSTCANCGSHLRASPGPPAQQGASAAATNQPAARAALLGCLGLIGGLFLLTLGISTLTDGCGGPKPSRGGATSSRGLTVADWGWKTGEFGARRLAGTVVNDSDKEYSYAQVEFNLYDDSGAQVGSTFTNINNLEPHATWRFEAVVLEDNATSARLKAVWGW
jgi:hypothetical protein